MFSLFIEVCAFNIRSCFIAAQAGAGRIEFCANPMEGGVTPGPGAIQYIMEHIAIPVFPMIRPRGGNFIYDSDELEVMRRDILFCRDAGCKGIATGIQLRGGVLDIENLKRLVEWAGPMEVTCHKVFDQVPDPSEALEQVISAGCTRILTSGLAKTAVGGASIIRLLNDQANGRIAIMPGGGVRADNIGGLVAATGATEYHSSALLKDDDLFIADEAEVRRLVGQR